MDIQHWLASFKSAVLRGKIAPLERADDSDKQGKIRKRYDMHKIRYASDRICMRYDMHEIRYASDRICIRYVYFDKIEWYT